MPGGSASGSSRFESTRVGEYLIESKLGSGAMGTVYRARSPALPDKVVALKVMSGASAGATARFRREIELLGSLAPHPNVVRIHGGDVSGDRPYFVMELVEGASLARLAANGLEPRRAAALVRGAAAGVAHVHAKGILHRDLKPENILVDAEMRARVCDFGLARAEESQRLTRTGAMLGTPQYSAPEQLTGEKDVDARADVYALGGILYFALTGRPPFVEATLQDLVARVLSDEPERPSLHAPGVPKALDAICLAALSKSREARQPSAAAFAKDLDAFLEKGKAVSAEARASARGASRSGRRRTGALVVVLAAAVAVVAVGGTLARKAQERAKALAAASAETGRSERLAAVASDVASASPLERSRLRVELARAAASCGRGASLVGEPGVPPGGVADLLLERTDRPALEAAERLAEERLRADPGDPAGRALRAYATLTRAGAPTAPLGAGKVGVALEKGEDERVDADLAAASSLAGAPGARAAWLRVELLLARRPATIVEAREAAEAARRIAGSAPERAILEEVLAAAPPELDRAVALFARLRDRGDAAAVRALGRLFAAWGAPGAVEHGEMPAPDALDAAARDLPPHLHPATPVATSEDEQKLHDAVVRATSAALHRASEPESPEFAAAVRKMRARMCEALSLSPTNPQLLWEAASSMSRRLTRGVFMLLALSHHLELWDFAINFNLETRTARGADATFTLGPIWETPFERFDAALAEDVRADEVLTTAIEHGLSPERVASAVRGVEGLRRIEELTEAPSLDAAARARIGFEALVRLEDALVAGGPGALPYRAWLRTLALGELGDSLAALDLARTVTVANETTSSGPNTADLLIFASGVAALAPEGSRARARWQKLYELGVRWTHAREVAKHSGPGGLEGREAGASDALGFTALRLTGMRGSEPLRQLRGVDRMSDDFKLTGEDRDQLRRQRPFAPPRSR